MKQEMAPEQFILHRMPWSNRLGGDEFDPVLLLMREWLVTNALGGCASASVSGACTRRYHGLLIAALPAPLGRMVMLSHMCEEMVLPDETAVDFSGEELRRSTSTCIPASSSRIHAGSGPSRLAVYYSGLHHREACVDAAFAEYRLYFVSVSVQQGIIRLRLRPSMHFREHEAPVSLPIHTTLQGAGGGDQYEALTDPPIPPLRFRLSDRMRHSCSDGGIQNHVLSRRAEPRLRIRG